MKNLAEDCIRLVGGVDNIKSVSHCATRLRVTLHDLSRIDEKSLLDIATVMKIIKVGSQVQIVVGSDAPELYESVSKIFDSEKENSQDRAVDKKAGQTEKESIASLVFEAFSSIFTPLVPVFTAAGMIKAILAILVAFGLSNTSQEYIIINSVSDTAFYYLPILLAVSCASYFGCNKFIAAAICAFYVYPTYIKMVDAGSSVSFFGIPVTLYNYSSTVFPTILTVWFMSYVEKIARKISPKIIKALFEPMVTFLVTFPVGIMLLGPVGAILGNGFMVIFSKIDIYVPFLVPTIMGAVTPFLVFVGMHRAVGTLETMQIAQQGSSALCGPGQLASNVAQGASVLVISLKTKDKKVKPLSFTAAITALCGITEPALYGFTANNKKALIATVVGGAAGGLYAGCTHLVRFAKGAPGLPTLPVFISLQDPMNIINAVITAAISFVVAFVVAWIIMKPHDVVESGI